MRLGFHLEDESDKSVLKAFIKKLTGHEVNSSEVFSPDEDDVLTGRRAFRGGRLRLTGDSYVLGHVEAACRDFHARYFRGMILGVDNDEAEPRHEDGHEGQEREFAVSGCRHCSVKIRIPKKFSPRKPEVDPFLPIISVPVEMLEAWVLFLKGIRRPESFPKKELKERLYGTANPARTVIEDTCIPLIEEMSEKDVADLAQASPSFESFSSQVREFVKRHRHHINTSPWEEVKGEE